MTNEAILLALNSVCDTARRSSHAALGSVERQQSATADFALDHLLRSLDDLRVLLSTAPAEQELVEEFDVALCVRQTIELLNLASGDGPGQIRLEDSKESLIIRQDRPGVEQVLTRTLDVASKLTEAGELYVATNPGSGGNGVRFAVTPPNSGVTLRLADWLNADPEQVGFANTAEAPFAVAVLVAGKHLRSMGGTAELVQNAGALAQLAIHLDSQPDGARVEDPSPGHRALQLDALNILLTEDSDDSYALTQLALRSENVWRARNGLEAIDIVKRRRFDVIFMDVHMPGMDGYRAIRAIRDWETLTGNARIPIVVLSSDDLETQYRSAARSGCSGFFRKPVSNADLLNLVTRLKVTRALAL